MKTFVEQFESGWIGLSIAFSEEEIDLLIKSLNELKDGQLDHFHFRRDDLNVLSGKFGLADVEISIMDSDEIHDMEIH